MGFGIRTLPGGEPVSVKSAFGQGAAAAWLPLLLLAFQLLFQLLLLLLALFALLFQLLFQLMLLLLALFSFLFLLLAQLLPLLLLRLSFQCLLLLQVFLLLLALYSFLFLFIVLCFLSFAYHVFLLENGSGPNSYRIDFSEITFILHRGTRDHPDRFSPTFSPWREVRTPSTRGPLSLIHI